MRTARATIPMTYLSQDKTDQSKPFLTAEWRYLAMLNYEVDPEMLQPHLPRGVELDSWHGRIYVSLVGFLFRDTKVVGIPIPFHRNFEEINLRFYVRRIVNGELRRGVVFIQEVVPHAAITFVARRLYNENYITLPTSHVIHAGKDDPAIVHGVEYFWGKADAQNHLRVLTAGPPGEMVAHSEEEFITEHFWGYSKQRDQGALEYHVDHPRWTIWQAKEASFQAADERLYGSYFTNVLKGKPLSAFMAEGSVIKVYKGSRIA